MQNGDGIQKGTYQQYNTDAKLDTIFDLIKETQDELKQRDTCIKHAQKECTNRFEKNEKQLARLWGGIAFASFVIPTILLIGRMLT